MNVKDAKLLGKATTVAGKIEGKGLRSTALKDLTDFRWRNLGRFS